MSHDLAAADSSASAPDPSGTKLGRFLANRGVIILKEIREIGMVRCDYGARLKAETLLLATARSSLKVSDKSFGVRLETIDADDDEESAHLDFDEIDEFCNAVTFIHDAAVKIANEKRDYTEATFVSKDDISVGFYQDVDQNQKAFIKLGRRAKSCFLPIATLPAVRKLIESARAHLVKKGAEGGS